MQPTEKLYFNDSSRLEFDAIVVDLTPEAKGYQVNP